MLDGVDELVEAQDLNALLRVVDGLCARRSWDELMELANRCEDALERGKQLWPIASHIDYRVALEAPGEYAAEVLTPENARFSHGPLTEVAASTHRWEDLASHIEYPQVAAYVAQERVLRGEVLEGDARAHSEILELPLELQAWEPVYALATYSGTYVEVAEPWEPTAPLAAVEPADGAAAISDLDVEEALLGLVAPWTGESNGAATVAVVEGDARAAGTALTLGPFRMGPLTPAEALQRLAWAAASGGAHGRRRGAALGRFLAWHTGAIVAGFDGPLEPGALGRAVGELRWYRFDEGVPEEGWVLRVAVEDPTAGWAAAIAATDLLEKPGRVL
ncbi:hypothetical protein BH18ACT15_BH18ACT15_05930 [soil metagenome]